MISSKNLADAIYSISLDHKKDDAILIDAIISYVKKYKLESLLPKALIYLEDKASKELGWNTLSILSRINIDKVTSDSIVKKIKADGAKNIKNGIDESLIGVFTATYKGVIYDASIKNQLQLLRNSLTK
jgi:F0F1-type ATP synthase delta subunit